MARNRNGEQEYVKGTTVQVFKTDASGFALDSIERDPDGNHWHVRADADPVLLRDEEEIRSVAAESSNTQ